MRKIKGFWPKWLKNLANWCNEMKNRKFMSLSDSSQNGWFGRENLNILYIGMPVERKKQRFFADFLPRVFYFS